MIKWLSDLIFGVKKEKESDSDSIPEKVVSNYDPPLRKSGNLPYEPRPSKKSDSKSEPYIPLSSSQDDLPQIDYGMLYDSSSDRYGSSYDSSSSDFSFGGGDSNGGGATGDW